MVQEFTAVHVVSLAAVGFLNLALAIIIPRQRPKEDVLPLAVFFAGIAFWTLPQSLLLVETDPTIGFVLAKTVDSAAIIMSTGLFHFAIVYTNRTSWLEPRRLGAVYLVTAGWVVLTWTNPAHGLMHDPVQFTEVLLPIEAYQNPIYWLYVLYNWALSGAGIYVFFLEYLDARGSGVYHKQARLVVLAPLIPGVANVLAHNGITAINYSVWGFGATGVLIAVALSRYRWLDLVPIARDSVIEDMHDGYLVVDTERRIVDLNPAARTLLGREQVVGKPIETVLPASQPLLDGTTQELNITRNGTIVETTVSPVRDERTDGLVLMFRDITDQRRAEKRFQALIENVSDVVTVVDADGNVSYVSPSIRSALGYRPSELVGKRLLDLVHEDDLSDATGEFTALLDDPEAETRFGYRIRHRDGSWVAFEGVAVNLLYNDIVGGVVINSRNVTERNARERELERTNQRLDEFAGVISHDLQTPLRHAQTYTRFAEESARQADFQAIHDAHERMETMITNLLTMARAGATLEEPEPVVIESVAEDAWRAMRTDGATLECDLEAGWTINGDRGQLLHVFENLFRNAIEHNDPPVAIRVGHLDSDPARGVVVFDDGDGIDAAYRGLVFERGHTTKGDGTGFGLAIVSDVIEAHGWRIDVCEGVTGGARFEIDTEAQMH
ncbi:PAS domain S-box protein [Natronosalvus halobius]|uniref:PAS domain S-box protein n=1 Tax=Natronosalvus halobius TaxID=2953746 RepID=UPI00209DB722|nr:histidine kinase N-terminal 7TM domain-containing protein [Natronosalvus halobius]USZ71486.1 PAS domain S-box protein [Natronosalvus halobius]